MNINLKISQISKLVPMILIMGTFIYGIGLFSLFAFQPEFCDAILFFPPWIYCLPGLLLLIPLFFYKRVYWGIGLILFWLCFLVVFQEEPKSIIRDLLVSWPSADWAEKQENGDVVRIISFNCAGRDIENIIQNKALKPDIILLQETVNPDQIDILKKELFREAAASSYTSGDSTIIANGAVTLAKDLPAQLHYFLPARIRLHSGLEIEMISLHLQAPENGYDLWNISCWRDHRNSRDRQQKQLNEIVDYIKSLPPEIPLIIGGDFNVPAGNRILRPLKNKLQDCFAVAGIGWGNTMLNDFPVMRFDQIWASHHFQPRTVVTKKSLTSDHRMVICDLEYSKTNGY
jgi:endonuclease/exonuclease/phosphatase (EEP) superfamily protein YafD